MNESRVRMVRYMIAAGVIVCASVSAFGQLGNGMPVGTPIFGPVGTQQPQVGTRQPGIGIQSPGYKPINSTSTKTNPLEGLNPNMVIGPYPTGMPATGEKSFWDKMYDRWLVLFKSDTPPAQNNWTPGLTRRNRERKENRFIRD